MDEESIQFLINLIKPHITKKDTVTRQSISPNESLLVTSVILFHFFLIP
nr:unnamed protein product [Callosobruchus analis]